MDELQSNQDCSRFGAFVQQEEEIHQRNSGSQAARGYLNGRRPLPSEFATYDMSMVGSNQHFQGFSHSGSLHDEQSLLSAFEDMTFRTGAADSSNDHRSAALTNEHCPSGRRDFILNQSHVSMTHQDEFIPIQLSVAYVNQKTDELAFDNREQAYSFPPHLGSRSSRQPKYDTIFSIPYHPSTASASPFQGHCYVDGQSSVYAPYDQGSNFIVTHDMGIQPFYVMQPHCVYPQMEQVFGLDVARNRRSNQQTSARLNSTFVDRFPSASYIDGSCGSGDFRQFRQQEKAACPYGPGFSHHRFMGKGNSTMSYPERILMRPGSVNPARSIKFSPTNGCTDMDQKINGFDNNHLDIQSNDSMNLEWLKPQFLSSKSESAMESPQLTYNSIDEVIGRICTVAKDQNGCRFLQKVFTEGTQEDAENVFAEIIDHIGELMVDPFAHYLVQKILEECSNDQRLRIICEITKVPVDLLKNSCNMHGTRVVQKIIETINTLEQALKAVSALSVGAIRLMTDPNGCHVVHRCLQKLLPEHKAFLLDAAASRHLQLARDRHGCCVIQKCIEHSNDDQKNNLLNNIASGALRLSEDQYGEPNILPLLKLLGRILLHYRATYLGKRFYKEHT
ncbi:hypothetical protein PR202_ga22105 [Eleusine coracana subsp. coracana]|uniref:PUM-HD domain-containing protein n=1 Tax=Eleusine coracana subsp. coracana TaxID=191504 RepID=A0AAV5D1D6_ELECO|nr:hypothetical protein PR202_ga22105 [Eleusine coracana subsp. coracana]